MAEKAHEKHRITPTAPGGSVEGKSRLLLFFHTVLSLLPFGPQTAPMGVRLTTIDGELVREIHPAVHHGGASDYKLVEAAWATMSAEEFEARYLRDPVS